MRAGAGVPSLRLAASLPAQRGRATPRCGRRSRLCSPKPPAPGFPTSGCSSPEARRRLQTCGIPRRPAALQTPSLCPAPRQDPQAASVLSRRDGARRGPRSRGRLGSPTPSSPSACRTCSCAFCHLAAPTRQPLGGGSHPSLDPEEERALAGVLRNRFLRDLSRVSQALAEAGDGEDLPPANGDANRYLHFPPIFPSPRPKFPPTSSPMWPKSQSFLMVDPSP